MQSAHHGYKADFSFGFACMIPLDLAEADRTSETTRAENLSCGVTDHKMLPPQPSVQPSKV